MENKLDIYVVVFFISFALFLGGLLALFLQMRSRQRILNKEKELLLQQHARQMLEAQLSTQQQTMRQIGREIHDNVGQKLTLAALYTQQIDYDNRYPELKEKFGGISAIINESLNDLRSLSKSLTSEHIEQGSLKNLLEAEIARLPPGLFDMEFSLEEVTIHQPEVKMMLVRIMQEFIQNTIKYAKATKIVIRLSMATGGLHFLLCDNGMGFDSAQHSSGTGLQNMKERITSVCGTLAIHTEPGKGTELEIYIPNDKL